MCQTKPSPSLAIRVKRFEAVAIPVGLASVEFADGGGCTKVVNGVDFLKCSILCAIDTKQWCVSFYYNEAKGECLMVLYTDAKVNMGDGKGWKKFLMQKG